MRLTVLVVASAAFLAGCGGSAMPRIARSDATPLISLSHRIATEGACAQARDIRTLQRDAARLVGEKRVPRALEQPFLGGVDALATRTPPCVPAVPPVSTSPTPPGPRRDHGHGRGHKHGDKAGD